jgi:uncharacterized protein YjbI with pentapeptide repeats/membrane protein implicated in regulation of membrane protease activity
MKRSSRWRRSLGGFSLLILALLAVAGASALVVRFAPPWLVSTSGLTGSARLSELSRVRIALLVLVLGALAAAVATYLFRSFARERREESRERQLTERFMRAVDQLGHPALDVRLGGIYSLERLARESPENHVPIIEILAAYVREHAPWPPRARGLAGDGNGHPAAGASPAGGRGAEARPRPSTDVEAAVTTIGRRVVAQDTGAPISLVRTALAGASLTGAHLERALLIGANLEGADLFKANLDAADLEGAILRNAGLLLASLNDTVLWAADAEGARLYGASLEGAALKGANLKSAGLTGANLKDAGLHSADLSGADLTGANLEGAGLEGANLEGANLQGANMRGAVVLNARYDETTIWPNGFDAAAQGAVSRAWQQELAARAAEQYEDPSLESPDVHSPEPGEAPSVQAEEGLPPTVGWPHEPEDVPHGTAGWPPPPPTRGWPHETREAPRSYSDWPPAPRQAPLGPDEAAEFDGEARHSEGRHDREDEPGA